MTKHQRQVLEELSKDQLIYLVELLRHSQFLIGETLVDESKQHITSEQAVREIRSSMCHIPCMYDADALKNYINARMENDL